MNYLVTGASGFLGRHVVQELAFRQPASRITAIVHATGADALRAWLASRRVNAAHVDIVRGDATGKDYGFDETTLAALRAGPLRVVDCAARYDLDDDDATRAERVNVDGARTLLALLARLDVRSLVHVSTTEVAGDAPGVFDERCRTTSGPWPSRYAASKARAEALFAAFAAGPARPPVAICRLGILVGHTVTGEFKNDGFYRFFPLIERVLGKLPSNVPVPIPGWASIPLCPVDFAAEALVTVLEDRERHGLDHFHVHDPQTRDVAALFAEMLRAAGNANRTMSLPLQRVRRAAGTLLGHDRHARDLRASITRVGQELGLPAALQGRLFGATTYDNALTAGYLARRGVVCPELDAYAAKLYWTWRGASRTRPRPPSGARAPRRLGESGDGEPGRALDGRRVLLTGCTSGVGLALASRLAARGVELVLLHRSEEKARALIHALPPSGGRITPVLCDLADRRSVESAVRAIETRGLAPDIIVHAAGLSICREVTRTKDIYADLDRVFEVNYFAAARLCSALVPGMLARGFGHVVSLSSISTQVDTPRFALYSSSKTAFDRFLRTMKSENIGSGLHVSSVHLPLVETPMTRPNPSLREVPMIHVEEAVDRIERVLESRACRSSTSTGTFVSFMDLLSPRTACVTGFLVWKFMAHVPHFARLFRSLRRASA